MDRPRPEHLTLDNALRFSDDEVAQYYHLRLPYPDALFTFMGTLITDEPRKMLDVGTGRGEIARPMLPYVDHIDAIDISTAMMDRGKQQPGGESPSLHWIEGKIEEVPLEGPYALITAGSSMHWMAWETIFPKFAQWLTPNGFLAIVHRDHFSTPWEEEYGKIRQQYSTYQNYKGYDLIEELSARGLFREVGVYQAEPQAVTRSIDDYINMAHSFSSMSLKYMTPENVAAFDDALRALVAPYATDGILTLATRGSVVYGKPLG